MRWIDQYVAIAAGGVIGASVRWAVAQGFDTTFPWPTLLVNVVGCALLAGVMAKASRARTQVFLATGFCGGLTTFSTLTVESAEMLDDGDLATMFVYLAASLGLGLLAYTGVRRALHPNAAGHR